MTQFQSNQEFYEFVRVLAQDLEESGKQSASMMLTDGLACINGLTDGWAAFLESVENVQRSFGEELKSSDAERVEEIRMAAHKAVYRS